MALQAAVYPARLLPLKQQFPIWANLSREDRHFYFSFLLSRLAHNFLWLRGCLIAYTEEKTAKNRVFLTQLSCPSRRMILAGA
jgi:hypothetical protein